MLKTKELFENFDSSVESKFREFLYIFLKKYKDNPTRAKFIRLIINLPLGYFINKSDIEKFFIDNKIPTFDTLLEFLADKQNFRNII